MSNIRVLIHETPKMLREILAEAIASQSDMEVIAGPLTVERPLPPPLEDVLSSPIWGPG